MTETLKDGGILQRVTGVDTVVRVTPVLDTGAYAQNDIFFATTEVPGALLVAGGTAWWSHLRMWDKSKQNRAVRIMLLRSNQSVGAANAAEAITDAQGLEIVAEVDIAAGDYVDYANFSVVQKSVSDLDSPIIKPSSGTSFYTGGKYTDATGDTYAASDIVLEFGFAPGVS